MEIVCISYQGELNVASENQEILIYSMKDRI